MKQWMTSLFDLTFAEPICRAKVRSKYLLKPKSAEKVWSKYILRPKFS